MPRYSCPDCQDTGRYVERGRLPGDRDVTVACDCRPRDTQAHEDLMATERAARDEADRLMRQPLETKPKTPNTASEGAKMMLAMIARLEREIAP